ncbi:MAG: helix-turn-helix transcriptional regulator [Oscillospiraceae bacterium]|nr:helix-turn-helix transcriptional regulator [Oscillospiraceae bacterium]
MQQINKETFGAFVAQLRKEKGLTQKDLARRLFISDKAVSKWETGANIPDTSLLLPLAELLGVTVTELLMGRRLPSGSPSLNSGEVEDLVKAADSYPNTSNTQKRWIVFYFCALAAGLCGLLLCRTQSLSTQNLLTGLLLGAVFGGYFCFFAPPCLPAYYDQNRISAFSHGPMRMNIPGISFNNKNWPHILLVGRLWACLSLVLLPLVYLFGGILFPLFWARAELYVFLLLFLGGLFLPLVIAGKKYQ